MNPQISKEIESENVVDRGGSETKVDTVDYQSSAGKPQEPKNVEVIHQIPPGQKSTTSGGILAGAAAAAVTTLESAKDAISGSNTNNKSPNN